MSLRIMLSVALLFVLVAGCTATREPIVTVEPAFAPASVDWSRSTRINVVLESFDFTPDRMTFERGQPYRLHLENHANGGHNFDAPEFFRSVYLRPDATSAKIKAAGGVIELRRNGATDIYFVPTKSGNFPLECSHFLHGSFGMVGKIVVK